MTKKRTIYLSGPMTGLKDFNYPRFHGAARGLREQGHFVFNPAEYPAEFEARKSFAAYTNFICLTADTIVMLEGWGLSVGASAEWHLAKAVGLDVMDIRDFEG